MLQGSCEAAAGAVAAWGDLHARYGKLDWKDLFRPAIAMATAVSASIASSVSPSR